MRVLFTVSSLAPEYGGPSRCVPQLAQALAQTGLEVALWTADGTRSSEAVPSVAQPSGRLRSVIDEFCPDLVHDHGLWLPANHSVAREARRARISRVSSPHGMLMPWCLNHHAIRKRVAWLAYQRADFLSAGALHATAADEEAQLRALGYQGPVIISPNGVDPPVLLPVERAREVLFLGRIHPKKGLLMLAEAWALTRPPGWRIRVVGPDEGGHRDVLRDHVRRLGIEPDWSIEDGVDDARKWELLSAVELVVLPSHSENFGIVVAESLAASTPVISTTGTPWHGLVDQGCGWWVEPTVEGLSTALRAATALSSEERSHMGQRGARWAAEEFGWERAARLLVEGYASLVAARRS